jgi:hypothetical protein
MGKLLESYIIAHADLIVSKTRIVAQTGVPPSPQELQELGEGNQRLGKMAGLRGDRIVELENEGFRTAGFDRRT